MRPRLPRKPSRAIQDAERARETLVWRLLAAPADADVTELRALLEAADRRLVELRVNEGARA